MYGMSAKDRMAMFEKGGDTKKAKPGPKKIGKLKVGNNNKGAEEEKNAVPPKKAKSKPSDTKKQNEEKVEVKKDTKLKEQKDNPVSKEEPAQKPAINEKDVKTEEMKEKVIKKEGTVVEKKEIGTENKTAEDTPKAKLTEPKKDTKTESKPAVEPQAKDQTLNPIAADKTEHLLEEKPKQDKNKTKELKKQEDVKVTDAPKKQEDLKVKDAPKKQEAKENETPSEGVSKVNETPKKEDIKAQEKPKKEDIKAQEKTKEEEKAQEKPKQEEIKAKQPQTEEDTNVKGAPKEQEIKEKDNVQKENQKKEDTVVKDIQKNDENTEKVVIKKDVTKKKETPKNEVTKSTEVIEKSEVKDNTNEEKVKDSSLQVNDGEVSKSEQPKDVPDAEALVRKRRRPQFIPVPEEVYDTLFYFSGMGTVVGSAMNEGVYVPVRATKTALETEVIDEVESAKEKEREQDTVVIRTARTQAFDITEELRKLQLLLNGLPNFGEQQSDLHKIDVKPADSVMHAKYHNFQQVVQGPTPTKPLDVTTRKDVPQIPTSQWPPPVIPGPPKQTPLSMQNVSNAHTKPVALSGKEKDAGVFKGVTSDAPSTKLAPKANQPRQGGARPYGVYTAKPESGTSQSWQEKYGTKSVDDTKGPEPFHQEGEIPSGLKPWQLSRLRGLEAKGYQFAHLEPKSGADYSDSFYHGSTSLELEGMKLKSLAPYLVSGISQSVDREQKEAIAPVSAATFNLKKHSGFDSHGENLPYCDL